MKAAWLLLAPTSALLLRPSLPAQPWCRRASPLCCTALEQNNAQLDVEAAQLNNERRRLLAELSDLDAKIEATEALRRAALMPVDDADFVRTGIPTELLAGPAKSPEEVAVGLGSKSSAFEPSFGYLSKSAGSYVDTLNDANLDGRAGPPSNFFDLAFRNFRREFAELLIALGVWRAEAGGAPEVADGAEGDPHAKELRLANASSAAAAQSSAALRRALSELELSNENVWQREAARPQVQAPLVLKVPYYALCYLLDAAFDGRPIARFWFLETVARIPYFSYISLLHLYESLGWWRRSAETKQVHFAEEWNEFHHLLIMESLGGDQRWADRFLAQHSAVLYFWVLVGLWVFSPSLAYNFSELIEAHAVDTYSEFVDANEEKLKQLPAPRIAKLYYEGPELFYFDEFQTSRPRGSRRPTVDNLCDVFRNIAEDEMEHVITMAQCQDPRALRRAPRVELGVLGAAAVAVVASRGGEGGGEGGGKWDLWERFGSIDALSDGGSLSPLADAAADAASGGRGQLMDTLGEALGEALTSLQALIEAILNSNLLG